MIKLLVSTKKPIQFPNTTTFTAAGITGPQTKNLRS